MASNQASPSTSLLLNLRSELVRYVPFAQMATDDLDYLLEHSVQQYFAPGEVVIALESPVADALFFVRRGAVTSERKEGAACGGAFQYEAGDMFPVSAVVAKRAVTTTYRSIADTFVLVLRREAMLQLMVRSGVFADFLNRRIQTFLELSRKALQTAYSSQALMEQSLERRLSEVVQRVPVTCESTTPLRDALTTMYQQRIGSMLVTSPAGIPEGILTRYDILGRVTLAGVPLDRPIGEVMAHPVFTLTDSHTAEDAALLMGRESLRHVPVTHNGKAVGIVSERDLFALQRLSFRQVGAELRAATTVDILKALALKIRGLAHSLLAQGVQARQLTGLVSHLNDVLTERLLVLTAARLGVDLQRVCWLALGSEGRSEQTIATDQDNALILRADATGQERRHWLACAQAVNVALDACGYPLCKGGVMAGNPDCCLTLDQWRARFLHWVEHGAPQDLLNSSIYFDFRCIAGDVSMAQVLRLEVTQSAQKVPRFLKQLASNALVHGVPLNWLGGIATDHEEKIDLKLQGTAVFVDAARLFAMAQGVTSTGTRERLKAAGPKMGVTASEYEAWVGGFEFVQMLRLRIQLESKPKADQPNHMALAMLNDIDRRILKEAFRVGRSMQQRMQLDYER